jgi:hypothetical protein
LILLIILLTSRFPRIILFEMEYLKDINIMRRILTIPKFIEYCKKISEYTLDEKMFIERIEQWNKNMYNQE